jgi:hypothetical protein
MPTAKRNTVTIELTVEQDRACRGHGQQQERDRKLQRKSSGASAVLEGHGRRRSPDAPGRPQLATSLTIPPSSH